MAEAQKEYSRQDIAEDKRKAGSQEVLTALKVKKGELLKDNEGKLKLSNTWVEKAKLSPTQVGKVWGELGINDPKDKDEVAKKVAEWQEKNKILNKDGKADGVLGWATLEALDKAIEETDKKWDKDNSNTDKQGYEIAGNKEGYGLSRVGFHEKKNAEQAKEKEDKTAKNQEYSTKLKEDIKSDDRGVTENLKDINGNPLTLNQETKQVEGTGDNSGKIYNVDSHEYEEKDLIATNILDPKITTKGEIDVNGQKFWKVEGIDGNPMGIRWKDSTKTNPNDPKEYYNIKEKKWEEYTPDIRQKMAREGLQNTLKSTKTAGTDAAKDVLSWTGRNNKNFTAMPISGIDMGQLYGGDSHTNIAKPILEKIAATYKALSPEDQAALKEKKVTIGEFRDMLENPVKAAVKFAPSDKPGKLPAGLGAPDSQYQTYKDKIFVFREGDGIPKVLSEDGKPKDIREEFDQDGNHKLPDGKELRVSTKDGRKTFSVAEKATAGDPRWVINEKGELEEIKKV